MDVLAALSAWQSDGIDTALIVLTNTEGGGVRAAGAMMAVSETGMSAGYLSGGCIDSDVAAQAQAAITTQKPAQLRYGSGSPFIDIQLPCGGAIDVLILPSPDAGIIRDATTVLAARQAFSLACTTSGTITRHNGARTGWQGETFNIFCAPKLRLRIAGRGADCLALTRLAVASGIAVTLQTPDENDAASAKREGAECVQHLTSTHDLPTISDDPWTAFALMFHDAHWEAALLAQALDGPAFYIGAVGSKKTHARRTSALLTQSIPANTIKRVQAPIGLVPSMRNATGIAISALAEITDQFENHPAPLEQSIALILLAAGASSRYESGDKLLADLDGASVLQRTASLAKGKDFAAKLAVIAPHQQERAQILRAAGWVIVENPLSEEGQATSLQAALAHIADETSINGALLTLADMPCIPDSHINALINEAADAPEAVMTDTGATLCPPAYFHASTFPALMQLSGDHGAKRVFNTLRNTRTVHLAPELATDVDYVADLSNVKALIDD
jgi:xanthine dehydrogenase accessory factor